MRYKLQRYWTVLRYDLPNFFRSLWIFRKALWNYKWYSGHHGVFDFMSTAIKDMHTNIEERGIEEWVSKGKKVAAMKRLVYLLDMFNEETFVEEAEKELGMQFIYKDFKFEPKDGDGANGYYMIPTTTDEEDAHNDVILKKAREIQKAGWKELIHLINGQDYSKLSKKKEWLDFFDGSGIRGWWD